MFGVIVTTARGRLSRIRLGGVSPQMLATTARSAIPAQLLHELLFDTHGSMARTVMQRVASAVNGTDK